MVASSAALPLPPPPPPGMDGRSPRTALRGRVVGAIAWLRARPVLVLFLLSPGIVEYLSGSSPLNAIVLNPAWFLLQLGLNAGLYLPGVLLIREAVVRWRKGWASVLVLGAAYGILEEGVALNTLFNPHAQVVQSLGVYGHWMGVNTVWLPGVLLVHMLWSIALPIFLFSLLFPELRAQPLLTPPRLRIALAALSADVVALGLVTGPAGHFFMGWPLLLGSLATIALLAVAAYLLPGDLLERSPGRPSPGGVWLPAAVGVGLYLGTILIQGFAEYFHAPPAVAIVGVVSFALVIGGYAWRYLRGPVAYRARLVFLAGTLAPIQLFGFLAQFPIDLVLIGDAMLALLFLTLWRRPARAALARDEAPNLRGRPLAG